MAKPEADASKPGVAVVWSGILNVLGAMLGGIAVAYALTAQYVPWWVRVMSALCLGAGTMIGHKRIVTTPGEKLGKQHLAPAQGAAAEIGAAGPIGGAGVSGFPVSTTHGVPGGIAGTTVALSAGLFYLLS